MMDLFPWWACWGALIVLAIAVGIYCWVEGAASVQLRWDLERAEQAVAVTDMARRRSEATVRVVTEYVDRVKIVREKGAEIVKEVPVYVPFGSCDLPGGFRLLHDAAAGNTIPDPARIADAAPVSAQTVTTAVIGNYTVCNETAEQLSGLQAWVRAQQKLAY